MMQWSSLLSSKRLGKDESKNEPAPPPHGQREPQRSLFQQDYDRIIFSSAFRRLQDKTQVYPLSESDYVRTRLTHSLEAGSVGRSLGTAIMHELQRELPEGVYPSGVHPSSVGDIVAAACLAHDIGNPPFGHSGEDAIRHWFEHSACGRKMQARLREEEQEDFRAFEGNAQGFRILTRLQMHKDRGGMQLTCATLGAFTKYPRQSHPRRVAGDRRASAKKFSCFRAEAPLFAEVAAETGLLPDGGGGWRRHPLAFIVEAADDICYRLVDLEDGARLGLLEERSMEEIFRYFTAVYGGPETREKQEEDIRYAREKLGWEGGLQFLRAKAIGKIIEQAKAVFVEKHDAILAGDFDTPLIEACPGHPALQKIIEVSCQQLYISRRVMEIEAAGFEVIGGLLDLFVEAVETWAQARPPKKTPPRWRSALNLIPEQFIGPGREPDPDAYTRLLRITDYVSGMTDTYAVSLYKKLRGISLPSR